MERHSIEWHGFTARHISKLFLQTKLGRERQKYQDENKFQQKESRIFLDLMASGSPPPPTPCLLNVKWSPWQYTSPYWWRNNASLVCYTTRIPLALIKIITYFYLISRQKFNLISKHFGLYNAATLIRWPFQRINICTVGQFKDLQPSFYYYYYSCCTYITQQHQKQQLPIITAQIFKFNLIPRVVK